MSALASLVRAYDRMAARGEIPPYGYSQEKISFVIPLNPDGSVAHAPIDIRQGEGKKKTARLMPVPASFKRPGVTPKPSFYGTIRPLRWVCQQLKVRMVARGSGLPG